MVHTQRGENAEARNKSAKEKYMKKINIQMCITICVFVSFQNHLMFYDYLGMYSRSNITNV